MVAGRGRVLAAWALARAKYWTGTGRPHLNCTGRAGLNNYVTVVVGGV